MNEELDAEAMVSKEPHEWTEENLLNLISSKAQESLTLEFKACGALTNKSWRQELAKDVSAFANSAGGILIYGIKENESTHEAEEIDIGFNPRQPSKEQLEQIINSNVHRRIDDVRYNAIPLRRTRPGRVAYVISVPESSHAPHMAHHRFYKRFEFESVPMEEFEVRERYRRETYPSKDIVRAWFDDGLNPLLGSLLSEQGELNKESWAWSHMHKCFNGLSPNLSTQLNRSANQDDFLGMYPDVASALVEHDRSVEVLNERGQEYYSEVEDSQALRTLVKRATSMRALKGLKSANPHKLTGNTRSELMGQIFSNQEVTENTLKWFAEYSINETQTFQNDTLMAFWKKHRESFFQIPLKRPFAKTRGRVLEARVELSERGQALIAVLENIRSMLSKEHGVPFEETRRTIVYEPYSMGLSGVYK